MYKALITILAMTLTAGASLAQVPKSQGFVFHGFGRGFDFGSNGHTGVGGEGAIYKGLTVGGDIGVLYPLRSPSGVIGMANANGGYHFTAGRKDTKWDPFVTGGYTLLFRSEAIGGFNYGGGIVYWFKPRYGIRVEFRDHRFESGRTSLPEFRIGLSFH